MAHGFTHAQGGQRPLLRPALSRALVEPLPLPSTVSQRAVLCAPEEATGALDGLLGAPFRESGQALDSLMPAIPWVLCPGSRWPSPSTSTPRQTLCNHLRGPGHSPSQEHELYI